MERAGWYFGPTVGPFHPLAVRVCSAMSPPTNPSLQKSPTSYVYSRSPSTQSQAEPCSRPGSLSHPPVALVIAGFGAEYGRVDALAGEGAGVVDVMGVVKRRTRSSGGPQLRGS